MNGNGNGNGNGKGYGEKRDELVAVGIDKDKNSQYALKWAIDHILNRGQTINLIYVKQKPSTIPTPLGNHVAMSDVNDGVAKAIKNHIDSQAKDVFLPFRAFCTRKDIKANEVILEDMDVANAICNYVKMNLVETLVIGASTKNSFIRRFKSTDVPANVSKGAPEFCSIYVISKGKISSVRSASIPVPNPPPRPLPTQNIYYSNSTASERPTSYNTPPHSFNEDSEIRSPFNRYHQASSKTGSFGELLSSFPENNSDISCVGRPSIEQRMYDFQELGGPPRLSIGSDSDTARMSIGSAVSAPKSPDRQGFSSSSDGGGTMSWSSSHNQDEVEAEMRRLKQELKQTMDMYSNACKETLTANQKAMDLQQWKTDEQQKVGRPRLSEQATMEIIEKEKAKTKAAIEAAEAAQRMAELEAKKRINAEMVARKESEERRKVEDELSRTDVRYRKYSIEEIEAATDHFAISRKIGEGGYGPVYKCYLDHTPVAVKVLRPDAAQGRSQFQQEVEVLSCIRHPNMVLLLGACPEYGCLVYEYMGNGSLEDRLYRRGNTPIIPWQLRFKIAAEIATGLLFLHQAKPEPLVHRDLKPANILLDQNYVSKISDVGLARLVPPSVADTVTQYRMTSTAGTFCYIDPEYQQTGMLGIKSDIYSLGILLLQIITGKPPMGLTHHVERAIERGVFVDVLDPYVSDWPVQDTLIFAKIALQCAELRRKDRPDLKNVVLPELNRLRNMAEDGNPLSSMTMRDGAQTSPCQSQISLLSSHEMNSESSQSTLGSSYN